MNLNKKQKYFLLVSLLVIVSVFIGLELVWPSVKERYSLSGDPQPDEYGCAPWSMYLVDKKAVGEPHRGEMVAIKAKGVGKWLKDGAVITKFVVGVPGDTVEVKNDRIWVNNQYFGRLWLIGTLKKQSGYFDRKEVIPEGQFLAMNVEKTSFDGRYWGYVSNSRIIGRSYIIY